MSNISDLAIGEEILFSGNNLLFWYSGLLCGARTEFNKEAGESLYTLLISGEEIGTTVWKKSMVAILQTTRQTVSKYAEKTQWPDRIVGKMMPINRNAVREVINNLIGAGFRRATTLFKVFCYMYYNCSLFKVFSKSQKAMAAELGMDYSDFNEVLQYLIDQHYFKVKDHAYFNFKEAAGKSATYILGDYFEQFSC